MKITPDTDNPEEMELVDCPACGDLNNLSTDDYVEVDGMMEGGWTTCALCGSMEEDARGKVPTVLAAAFRLHGMRGAFDAATDSTTRRRILTLLGDEARDQEVRRTVSRLPH